MILTDIPAEKYFMEFLLHYVNDVSHHALLGYLWILGCALFLIGSDGDYFRGPFGTIFGEMLKSNLLKLLGGGSIIY